MRLRWGHLPLPSRERTLPWQASLRSTQAREEGDDDGGGYGGAAGYDDLYGGGGYFHNTHSATITGGVWSGNSADAFGGAVLAIQTTQRPVTITLRKVTARNNHATQHGGVTL